MSSPDSQDIAPWMNGNIGVLKSGRVLAVTLKRPENTFYVNEDYEMIEEEAIEIFESFLGLRIKFLKHKYTTAVVPSIKDDPEFYKVSRDDVHRVAMYICDPKVVETQTEEFINTFFGQGQERLNQKDFIKVLLSECERRKLTKWECFFLLFEDPSSSTLSYIVAVVIMTLIVVSSFCFVLSTDPSFQVDSNDPDLPPEPHPSFVVIEMICIYCFLVEYLCRVLVVWAVRKGVVGSSKQKYVVMECFPSYHSSSNRSIRSSPQSSKSSGNSSKNRQVKSRKSSVNYMDRDAAVVGLARWWLPISRTINYVVSPMNLIDLIAILPFFISQLLGGEGGNLSSLRILRLARVMRIFKLAKKNEGINMLSTTMAMSRGSLNLLVFFGIIGTVVFGSLIYFTESGTWHNPDECERALPGFDGCSEGMFLRPDKFGFGKELTPFSSIPRTFWWVVVTATTVGYGDMYPTTALGKLVATFAMVSGLLVLALPISIIGTNFLVCYEKLDERNRRARLLEELEEKMKKEEKEAVLEAAHSLETKQRDALDRMPWRSRKKAAGSKRTSIIKSKVGGIRSSGGVFRFKTSSQQKKFSAAAVAASWTVSGSPNTPKKPKPFQEEKEATVATSTTSTTSTGEDTGQQASNKDSTKDSKASSEIAVTTKQSSVGFEKPLNISSVLSTPTKGLKLRTSKALVTQKLKQRLGQRKSMINGHQSLVALKAKARLVPSFLYDTDGILNPPASLKFINVERKSSILALSLAGFGKTRYRKSNHMSDVALAVKYKPLLDKARDVLECIQAFHTRGKVDDPTALNVAREIVDLTRKIILLKEKEFQPLRVIGSEVDAAVLVVLAWLGRDADSFLHGDEDLFEEENMREEKEEEKFKLEAEDERRIRLYLFEYTVTALDMAKKQLAAHDFHNENKVKNKSTTSSGSVSFQEMTRENQDNQSNPMPAAKSEDNREVNETSSQVGASKMIGSEKVEQPKEDTSNSGGDGDGGEVFTSDGDIQGKQSTMTGRSVSSLSPNRLFGEGSFQVKMGDQGMDFTLL